MTTSACYPNCSQEVMIIRGSDRVLTLRVYNSDTCSPFDLDTADPVKVFFPKEDGTMLEKNLTNGVAIVSPAQAGQMTVTLSDTDTNLLRIGERQDFEVEITKSSTVSIVQFKKCLSIRPRISC